MALSERDPVVRIGSTIKCTGYGTWLVLDMIQWLNIVGVINMEKKTIIGINQLAPRLWLLGIASGAVVNLHRLNVFLRSKRKAKTSDPDPDVSVELAIEKHSRDAIQDTIDLLIPLSIIGWLPLSQGQIGLAGSITSLMGAYSIYPEN